MIKALAIETVFADVPLYERFALVREVGFDWIELGDWTELDLTNVIDALTHNRMRLAAVVGAQRHVLTDPGQVDDFLEYLSQSIAVSKHMGCSNLLITSAEEATEAFTGESARQRDIATKKATAIQALTAAAAKAKRAGVTLCVGSTPTERGADAVFRDNAAVGELLRSVSSPVLRLLFDVTGPESLDGSKTPAITLYQDLVGYVRVAVGPDDCVAGDWNAVTKILSEKYRFNWSVSFVFGKGVADPGSLKHIRAL